MTPRERTNLLLLIQEYARTEYLLGGADPLGDPDEHHLRATNRHSAFTAVLNAVFTIGLFEGEENESN